MKLLRGKNNKYFWIYITFGAIFVLLSIFLAPFWSNVNVFWKNFGQSFLNIIIAICLGTYLFAYLLKKIISTRRQVIKVLTIIEFAWLLLIALYLVIGQWVPEINIFKVNGACAIIGLALWIRGIVEIFRAYYYNGGNEEKYPVWWLCISIAFVSIGMWMLVAPFISDIIILWIVVALLLVLGIAFIAYGIYSKPAKVKTK